MDFFDSRYYSMNRKLLLLVGLWPFQDKTTRLARQLSVVCIGISAICVQVAKVMTTQLTIDMIAEIVTVQIGIAMCSIKYFSFTIQIKKIKMLLESIEAVWKCLCNDIDRGIARECAEEGRKYIFFVSVYAYTCTIIVIMLFALQPFLDVVAPKNETRKKLLIYPAEYFFDEQDYFYPILLHMTMTILVLVTVLLATDAMYVACIYHVRGIFKVISYRLEHAFDKFQLGTECTDNANSETRVRIASAVEYHLIVIQFVDVLISTFNIELLLSILLVFCNISITLYWATVSLANIHDLITALMFGAFQMIWTLVLVHPCQKVIDESSAIAFKAYSGVWYNAPFVLQTLLVPIIQRGTKPTMIYVAKSLVLTLEFYAKAIQLSISYFTVLLSLTST